MKKTSLLVLIIVTSFLFGFAAKTVLTPPSEKKAPRKKVTGIGGVFFKCKDPEKVRAWYQQHLGFDTNPYGASFEWYETPDSTKLRIAQWTPFPNKTKYFAPSKKDFMINYTVENLEMLVADLKREGVTIVDSIETYDYGKFVHILDLEGNKIQLWEPQ